MIGDALRIEIETFAKECRSHRLFRMAEDGLVNVSCVRDYLTNIHYLISHTPICLRRARDNAAALHREPLARHFAHKLEEEDGHDEWAESDLESLTQTAEMPAVTANVTPGMRALVEFILETIDTDPDLYLAYILFAEHFTVVMGPEWIKLLDERCGIPSSSLSVVANHAELDKEHVEEALGCIDDLVGDPRKLPRLRETLLTSMELFGRFCSDIATLHEKDVRDGSQPNQKAALHTSAA